jgi:DNA replication protein DnaC
MCGEYLKQGKETRYMLWSEESKKLKANINEDTYFEILEPFQRVEVLYIDDLFKVKKGQLPTSADVNIAFDLLNSRLLSKDKITIISSEFTLNELLIVDEGTISRIVEKAGRFVANIADCTAKNYRLRQ